MKMAIASDHGGWKLKEKIKEMLNQTGGIEIIDLGTNNEDSVDYPDYGVGVATKVSNNEVDSGILVCGTGIGMTTVASKFPNVRVALAYDKFSAEMAKRHNNANLLTLGAGLIGLNQAKLIVKTWLATEFAGGTVFSSGICRYHR